MDGLGWLAEKICRIMATYPQFTEDFILDELDGGKGWMYFAWSVANEANRYGTGVDLKGSGYIQQEKKKLADGKQR